MSYPPYEPEEWVACGPMFVEDGDGFALTDEARAWLALMDGEQPDRPAPTPPTVIERVAAVRAEIAALAAEMPAAVRALEPHELLDTLDAVQEMSNLLGSVDQAVVAEVDRSGAYERWGHPSTAALLLHRLRVRPAEAKRRVGTARACAARVSLRGEVLPPVRAIVAAAQADGTISADHAAVISRGLDRLPAHVPVDEVEFLEQTLVDCARGADPSYVAKAVRKMVDTYDPDGPKPRDEQQRRNRGVTLTQDDHGAGRLTGGLTAGLLAKLQAVLSPLAAPRPDDAHGPDTRTPGQRLHDALEDVCDRLLRSGTLPDSGGVPATVCVTMTLKELETRTGRVSTSHGGDLSVAELLQLASEAEVIPVVLNDAGGILTYGRKRRLASPAQTQALRARDRGCTFPGCSRPPEWCQRHHVDEWLRDHGPTDTDNLTLVCGYHHHNFERWGWQVVMRDGVPWWIPPTDLDPEQEPLRNRVFQTM